MWEIVGNTLTMAIASSVSPLILIVLLVLLGTKRAKQVGIVYAFGIYTAAVVLLMVSVYSQSTITGNDAATTTTGINYTSLVISFLFLWFGYKQYKGRPLPGDKAEVPKWLKDLNEMSAIKIFFFAIVINAVTVKNIPVYISIGLEVVSGNLPASQQLATILIIALCCVLIPIIILLIFMLGGAKVEAPLRSGKDWLVQHNAIIMTMIFVMLSLNSFGKAISGLLQ